MHVGARRFVVTVVTLVLVAIAGVAPSWALPGKAAASLTSSAVQPRTAADLPKPPKAMTSAARRAQVAKERLRLSPAGAFVRARHHSASDKPVPHSAERPSHKSAGDGARGIVMGQKGRRAHVFNVVNIKGDVVFLDGQSGHADVSPWRNFSLLRTD